MTSKQCAVEPQVTSDNYQKSYILIASLFCFLFYCFFVIASKFLEQKKKKINLYCADKGIFHDHESVVIFNDGIPILVIFWLLVLKNWSLLQYLNIPSFLNAKRLKLVIGPTSTNRISHNFTCSENITTIGLTTVYSLYWVNCNTILIVKMQLLQVFCYGLRSSTITILIFLLLWTWVINML